MSDFEEIVLKGIDEIAANTKTSPEQVMRFIYEKLDREYDRDDIAQYLDEHDYKVSEENISAVECYYRRNYDCNYGTWDNIAAAVEIAVRNGDLGDDDDEDE